MWTENSVDGVNIPLPPLSPINTHEKLSDGVGNTLRWRRHILSPTHACLNWETLRDGLQLRIAPLPLLSLNCGKDGFPGRPGLAADLLHSSNGNLSGVSLHACASADMFTLCWRSAIRTFASHFRPKSSSGGECNLHRLEDLFPIE